MTPLFWGLLAIILYSLVGYGLIWSALAALFGRPEETGQEVRPLSATVLIAARNEELTIDAKIASILAQDTAPHRIRTMVVSDGSEDGTLAAARRSGSPLVTALQTDAHGGKAEALNLGLARTRDDVVIFSDANSLLAPDAIRRLLAPFADPGVGGVCGRQVPVPSGHGGWLARMERLFWSYDNGLKRAESRLGGAVSAQGTLYAMRRDLLPATVPATVADDFYISVQAPAAGRRLVYEGRAMARERVSSRAGAEFMRRVRSTERGWRGLMRMRGLLNPVRHGLYAVQLFSHKALRRLVAFLLPLLLVVNGLILDQGVIYQWSFLAQLVLWSAGLLAVMGPGTIRIPGAGLCGFFVMGHTAMALGILRAASGIQSRRWSPIRQEVSE